MAVDGFGAIFGWLTGHEQLLSALAALVVIGGVIVSPVGRGLRAVLARRPEADNAQPQHPPMIEDRPSIAVLPFTNMSDDREQEFLADGMTEDVITGLALSRALFVIARNSTFSYKGKSPNVRDVGRELGVRYVLEGSLRRIGDNLRVTTQLIDTRTGAHLSAETFDRPLAEIFEMQDEITASIVAGLTSHLTRAATVAVARARPENLDAWQLCMRGMAQFSGALDADSGRAADAMLRAAVKKDPAFGPAWVYLGFVVATRWMLEPGTDTAASRKEAREHVERGTRLAPTDPEVLAFKGGYLTFAGQPREAVTYLEQALQLNPNEVGYRAILARALNYTGRPAEALVQMEIALRLSPRDPLMPLFANDLSAIQYALGHFAEAESWARRSVGPFARLGLAVAIAAQGRADEAREVVRETLGEMPDMTLDAYEHVLLGIGYDKPYVDGLRQRLASVWPPEANNRDPLPAGAPSAPDV